MQNTNFPPILHTRFSHLSPIKRTICPLLCAKKNIRLATKNPPLTTHRTRTFPYANFPDKYPFLDLPRFPIAVILHPKNPPIPLTEHPLFPIQTSPINAPFSTFPLPHSRYFYTQKAPYTTHRTHSFPYTNFPDKHPFLNFPASP